MPQPSQRELVEGPCPACQEAALVPIVYGYPDSDLFESAKRGEVALGGCVLEERDPDVQCRACRTRFFVENGRLEAGTL